ncbi:hypothetical protein P3L10_031534 [Capsicum annuum]
MNFDFGITQSTTFFLDYQLSCKMGYRHLLFLASFFLNRLVVSSLSICPRDQSLALAKFNRSFGVDASFSPSFCGQRSYPKMNSWNMNRDCCSWDGVICDETSGRVIELDLSFSQLVGVIDYNSILFQLSHLQRLNLLSITSMVLSSRLNLASSRA